MGPLTIFEAAHILGLPPAKARRVLQQHDLTGPRTKKVHAAIPQIELIAMETYPWHAHAHAHDDQSYWLTATQAAEILGLSIARVKQLLDQYRLPHVLHRSGARLIRRRQLEVIANARVSRELRR